MPNEKYSSNETLPTTLPIGKQTRSSLVAETTGMERGRRIAEQNKHRKLAPVHAREHPEQQADALLAEGDVQNNIHQHPLLDAQRFDGADPNVNPAPALNTDARREYDNKRREQEQEKQERLELRLGNMPKFSTAPRLVRK